MAWLEFRFAIRKQLTWFHFLGNLRYMATANVLLSLHNPETVYPTVVPWPPYDSTQCPIHANKSLTMYDCSIYPVVFERYREIVRQPILAMARPMQLLISLHLRLTFRWLYHWLGCVYLRWLCLLDELNVNNRLVAWPLPLWHHMHRKTVTIWFFGAKYSNEKRKRRRAEIDWWELYWILYAKMHGIPQLKLNQKRLSLILHCFV